MFVALNSACVQLLHKYYITHNLTPQLLQRYAVQQLRGFHPRAPALRRPVPADPHHGLERGVPGWRPLPGHCIREYFVSFSRPLPIGGGGRCHNLKSGKEVSEVTEEKSCRMR